MDDRFRRFLVQALSADEIAVRESEGVVTPQPIPHLHHREVQVRFAF